MSIDKNDPRLQFLKLPDTPSLNPPGYYEHFKDMWWCVCPERGLIFWNPTPKYTLDGGRQYKGLGAPQCNLNVELTKGLKQKLYPWAIVIRYHSVFVKIDIGDYT